MNPFFRLICEFEILTPMFLGGASQEAELRVPSIKGALRFWYRALDPHYNDHEPVLFGSGGSDAGQSILLLRCKPGPRANEKMRWEDARVKQFDQGSGRQTKNGLTYLGFPLAMRGNEERTALVPGAKFTLELTCRQSSLQELRNGVTPLRAALASIWTLGHFGSLGTRSRRGFGAISLVDWRLERRESNAMVNDEDLAALPLLGRTSNSSAWTEKAHQGLNTVRTWFGPYDVNKRLLNPHFGPGSDLLVTRESVPRNDWRRAMLSLGRTFQDFRQRKQPDYDLVKNHVLYEMRQGGQRIERVPDRATFGLPLAFRFSSVPNGRPVNFTPVDGERHASLLFLRPVLTTDTLVNLFLKLDGQVPGKDTRVGLRGAPRALQSPAHNAMDEFIREMKGKG